MSDATQPQKRKVDPLNQLRQRKYEAGHGDAEAFNRQHAKGKLTARERIARLVDRNSFEELDLFATHRASGFDLESKRVPGDGVVTGMAKIEGRDVMLFSHDATVFGGSLGEVFAEKVIKVMDLALQNKIPIIGINDSGGARIQEGVVSLAGYAEIFWRNVESSGVIPQLSLILGPCTGGAVYSPAITDFTFMVHDIGYMFITGPDVIRVTTGENVTFDSLGGAEVHNVKSGVAHFLAETEDQSFAQVRRLFKYIPQSCADQPPRIEPTDDPERSAPGLATIIPDNPKEPYDIKEVIAMVVDGGDFMEVQPFYAMNIVVGFAHLDGNPVGVVANQPKVMAGALDINASDKAARFVRFCDAFNIPLITFVDVPGFLPGTSQEYGGIIRHGAKLLYAFSEATVPKLTVITRKAYGGAYCVMCSKHIRADFNVAWPTAEIAVMGPEGAVNILFRRELTAAADDAPARRRELVSEYTERFANPYIAAERGYIDDVIEPGRTRPELIRALKIAMRKERRRSPRWHGNIPL
jgi:acetyl-CoA carboxylase carboxyltransferase component